VSVDEDSQVLHLLLEVRGLAFNLLLAFGPLGRDGGGVGRAGGREGGREGGKEGGKVSVE